MGKPDSSIHYSNQALVLLYELAELPNPPDWTRNELAFVHSYIANASQDRGDIASADHHYREAIRHRGTVHSDPFFGFVIYRMLDEYAHFLEVHGTRDDALARHRDVARVLGSINDRLRETSGSPLAYSDVVAGLCHTAGHIAPYDSARADSLYALAVDTSTKHLGADHELTRRIERTRLNFHRDSLRPLERGKDAYARLAWLLSKRNAMWGENPWPEP
jgi:hypothetical protein